ncbi:YuzD family protein [Fictibacillus aquaticus]|uniref:Disulfide oxidoreductase n=1 Tax=Fictibacillus aquaticus TaxID=2021314 RepID=A0A235F4G0_9BACL|nr:YuzD family protein [Fictibacillus aquaticus]OYD55973.1 disulfide oxidoreductase [Fictibacillus aquaticus]
MTIKEVLIKVYGAEQKCPSCVNLPSSKETAEWLEAAIARKFPEQSFTISYINMESPETDEDTAFVEMMIEEDLFYPVVVIDGEVVAEGNPRLKTIFDYMEKSGYKAAV